MKILIFASNEEISKQLETIILKKYSEYAIETVECSRGADYIKNKEFDVVFIDDCFSDKCTTTAMFVQKMLPECKIIFISDNIGTISDILLNITLFGVIEKPLYPSKIYRYLEAAKDSINKPSEKFSFMEKGKKRNLMFSNIIYLESNREKLLIKTVRSAFSIWMKMSEAEPQFPDYFVRCHNSFLVNMKYVVGYESNSFKLINGQEIIVSRSKKEQTMEKFFAFKDLTR